MDKLISPQLLFIVITIGLSVIAGYFIARIRKYTVAISLAWVVMITGLVLVERLSVSFPPLPRMLAIILITLFGMKTVVCVEYYKGKTFKLTFIQWCCFVVGWFGMRPNLFESLGKETLGGGLALIRFGISRVVAGGILVFLSGFIYSNDHNTLSNIIATGAALAGLSLILHFGILNISAGMWRFQGADTRTLFKEPLRAASLAEFWGKRWNLAFSEMTAIALYRPLKLHIGEKTATVIAFLFSGLLHELAISVPVNAGYGLPLVYFFIQGVLIIIERRLEKQGILNNQNPIVKRIWVMTCLILPMPVLFHAYFLKGVVWPLIVW